MASATLKPTDPRHPRRNRLARPLALYGRGMALASGAVPPWVDLWIRLWLAQSFLVSGLVKVGSWEVALILARDEYPVTWLDPVTAAYTGATIELIAPVLLILGLATRASAFSLLVLSLVIQFNYIPLDIHLLWIALRWWLAIALLMVSFGQAQGLEPLFIVHRLASLAGAVGIGRLCCCWPVSAYGRQHWCS